MWQRLRNDFNLAIITLFGACAVLTIAPFAVFRFASGQPLVGAVDTAIVSCIVGAVSYAWRGGDPRWPAAFLALTNTAGCLVAAHLHPLGLHWVYPALLANYFLIPRGWAVGLSVAAFALLTAGEGVFATRLEALGFLASGALVSLLAFIFAARTEAQRRQLEALASLDSLTGAHNRRAMEQELARAAASHRRDRRAAGVVIVDLDHFKRVNDGSGHEAGDRVLQAFAGLVRDHTRESDRFFRYGGEEFVLLLPGADARALRGIGDALRATVADGLRHDGAPVTVSIGAAELCHGESWQDWLARADAALYRAKQGGRDRVEVAPDAAPSRAADDAQAHRSDYVPPSKPH